MLPLAFGMDNQEEMILQMKTFVCAMHQTWMLYNKLSFCLMKTKWAVLKIVPVIGNDYIFLQRHVQHSLSCDDIMTAQSKLAATWHHTCKCSRGNMSCVGSVSCETIVE